MRSRRTRKPRHNPLIVPVVTLVALLAALVIIGSIKYDGPDGLLLRARAAVAEHKGAGRNIPAFAPTPMPTPQGGYALDLIALQPTATPLPAPTATPTQQPPYEPAVEFAAFEKLPDPPTPTATSTPEPTATPTITPTPEPTATPNMSVVSIPGITHYWQTWNNCGPTSMAMYLSYYGLTLTQKETAAVLKPNWDDKNVSPAQMAAFARSQGLNAIVRVNGTPERIQSLLNAGVPVIMETWMNYEDGVGHYRLVTGFDQVAREWIVYDSFVTIGLDPKKPYGGIRISFDQMPGLWRVFNNTYIVVYDAARAGVVQQILGDELDDTVMWQRSLERAQAEAAANSGDAFAWFNMGNSLTALGRFSDAASAFDQARVIGLPSRMLWYQFELFHAYYETGRYDELLALADSVIAMGGNIEESYYWHGKARQALGDIEGARQDYRRAIELKNNYAEAQQVLTELGG